MLHNLKIHFNYTTLENHEPNVIVQYKDKYGNIKNGILRVKYSLTVIHHYKLRNLHMLKMRYVKHMII